MKRKIWIPAAMVALALVVWAFVGRDAADAESYRFVAVEQGTIETVVTSTGVLQPTETVEVGTQVSGQVAELFADFNDRVKKGQLLARIDPVILQQEVQSSQATVMRNQAEVDQAERALARSKDLFAEKVITETELEQAQYSFTVAKAAFTSAQVGLERARRNLAYTEIRAPIDGIIVERAADLGQTVSASTSAPTLFLLAQDLSQMEILASVDENDIGRISSGQAVRFTVQAYGDQEFTGVVKQVRLQSVKQDNVVSYSVVIGVANPDLRLLPAMTATVEFIVARADDVLKVPNAALRFQPTEEMRATAKASRQAANGSGDAAAPEGERSVRSGAARPTDGQAVTRGTGTAARGTGTAPRSVLWLIDDSGAPKMVPVQTGLTDGQSTEVRGPGVSEGMQVIAGTTGGTGTQAAPNPFQSTQRAPAGPGRF
ncbi:MAG TPA: efflux RND transporter periplasmic adaptor subunit [Longimicrobiales bacterium]|nr:efflux RND transporter periplasmic adaptor subunit [Longimicrobiales bacterium]